MSYDASAIKALEYPQNIQTRPGMYVGGRGASALLHLAIEVMDNAVDEAMGGHCDSIKVVLHKDASITISDNGRGIPVDVHPEYDKSTLELCFTHLHAGGKFDDNSYTTSGGLHGVGIKATNALSKWLVATVQRNGVRYRQRHKVGLPVTPVQILAPHTDKVIGQVGVRGEKKAIRENKDRSIGTGTTVAFAPNPEYLQATTFNFDALLRRMQVVSFLVPGVTMRIVDERGKKRREKTFKHTGGLREYVEYLNRDRQAIHSPPIKIEGAAPDGTTVQVVLQYHRGFDEEIVSFVNTIPTSDGGKHVSGFRQGLTKAINTFGSQKKLVKGTTIRGRDTIVGLTAVVNIQMRDPQFTSQTKTQLGSDPVQGQVSSIVYETLMKHFQKKMPVARKIIEQCITSSQARQAATQARSLVVRKSVLEVEGLPAKLADVSKGVPVEETTLYIVEGDSAGGSCKQARDRRHHAILPLRGKILNCEKARLTKALANQEIKSIIAALGAGVAKDFELDQLRYGRIGILVDADVDGAHIMCLLLTLFWRLMRPLVESGRLVIAAAPLYQLKRKQTTQYAYSDGERDRILEGWGGTDRITIQRYKGLGEMNPVQLRETVFAVGSDNPHISVVTTEDVTAANAALNLWMGASPARRREKLMELWDTNNGEKQ